VSVPAWVTTACQHWVLEQAKRRGELPLSELEFKARVMRMSAAEVREAREVC
jgi:hypothetical protein